MMSLLGKNFQVPLPLLGWLHRGGTSWCAPCHLGVQTDLFIRKDRVLRSFDSYIVDGLMEEMEKQNLPLHKHKGSHEA